MNTPTLPGGSSLLGRVLNANGSPIDGKGNLENTTHLPLSTLEALVKTVKVPTHPQETGIKTIDLMAPIAAGSVVGLIAGFGLGRDVVIEEIMHHLLIDRQGIGVIAGMRETTYDASNLREMVRDIEVEDRIAMLFEQTTEEVSVHQRLLHAAATIAAQFKAEGREVLLMIDCQVTPTEQIASLRRFANSLSITTLLLVPVNDLHQPTDTSLLKDLDVQIRFSQQRARQSLWPAIDPLASRSHFLSTSAIPLDHQQVTQRVREILERYYTLRENENTTALTEEDQQILTRGERIDLFFSQPFFVAEAFTDMPGTYLTREETVASFRDLLNGRYDDIPAQAFRFIGKIEQR